MIELTPAVLEELARVGQRVGLLRLSAVRLDHPGFAAANERLDLFLDEGRAGEMQFLTRTRAVRKDPASMLEGAQTLLVAVVPYDGEPGPIARYARSADYHSEMHVRFEHVAEALRSRIPSANTLVCVDTKPVQERAAAALAGLGFLGKNGMLIAPGLGSFVMLGALMTTARWQGPDAQVDLRRCRGRPVVRAVDVSTRVRPMRSWRLANSTPDVAFPTLRSSTAGRSKRTCKTVRANASLDVMSARMFVPTTPVAREGRESPTRRVYLPPPVRHVTPIRWCSPTSAVAGTARL
ncbi:MAG: DUF1730 domain-containing protein [Nannocystaceae bacterium]|nr:DUF1730 domain-containing protein [Nannocystaceae bacterium]